MSTDELFELVARGGRLTHRQLCERARSWLLGRGRCSIALVEFKTILSEIPDAIGFRNSGRESLLVECKASRSDFLADKNKPHRIGESDALGTYRWYMCEPDVIRIEDLPERWGLLYVDERQVKIIAGEDPYRTCWPPESDVWRWPNPAGDCVLLYSALRRLQIRLGATEFQRAAQSTFGEK